MQNAQCLNHTNGLAKYVCKYISKFDEYNYVMLCQDMHSGEWVLGQRHLHNTKVVTSKINEDKAFSRERHKNHFKGFKKAHMDIRQLFLGHPEIFTNMKNVIISTLPLEVRPRNTIKLDKIGNVIEDQNNINNPVDAYTSLNLIATQRMWEWGFTDYRQMSRIQ